MKLWEPNGRCPKAVLTHLLNHIVWSWTLECSVKSYVTRSSMKCSFNEFLLTRVLTHDKIEYISGCECSECQGLPVCVRPTYKRWFLKIIQVTNDTCRLYIHLASTYSLRWSLECSVKRTWTGSTFSTNESTSSAMDTGSKSRVWSGS